MSTATPAATATALTPGAQTSENALAKLAAFAGLGLVALGIILEVFHPISLAPQLVAYGVTLVGGSVVVYGGFRTALKWVAMAKSYEPEAEMAARLIPGAAGQVAQHYLPIVEKLIDALANSVPATPPAPGVDPMVSVAQAAGAAAAATPAKAL